MTDIVLTEEVVSLTVENNIVSVSVVDEDVSVTVIGGSPVGHAHNYEPLLGNPDTNGYVLASTVEGIRSWVRQSSDVDDLSTNNGTAGDMLRVSTGGDTLEYRTAVQVLSDIGAASVSHTHAYEPDLGNPDMDGYVLSSTVAGVRSWVEMSSGVEFPWQPNTAGEYDILQDENGNAMLTVNTSTDRMTFDPGPTALWELQLRRGTPSDGYRSFSMQSKGATNTFGSLLMLDQANSPFGYHVSQMSFYAGGSSITAGIWLQANSGGGGKVILGTSGTGGKPLYFNLNGADRYMLSDTEFRFLGNQDLVMGTGSGIRPLADTSSWSWLQDASGNPIAYADSINGTAWFGTEIDVLMGSRAGDGYIGSTNGLMAIGTNAARNASGLSNTYIGPDAGYTAVGDNNFGAGARALQNSTGGGHTAIGVSAGRGTTGIGLTLCGPSAGENSGGNYNQFFGGYSGYGFISGNKSIGIGQDSMRDGEGFSTVAIGDSAGRDSNANYGVYVGRYMGQNNTTANRLMIGNTLDFPLLDGIMGSTTAEQELKINADTITIGMLPTSDPSVAGRLWNDRGTLKVSRGYFDGFDFSKASNSMYLGVF